MKDQCDFQPGHEPGDLIVIDLETTRLRPSHLPGGRRAWEIGGLRVNADGSRNKLHLFTDIDYLGLEGILARECPDAARALSEGGDDAPTPGHQGTWFHHLPEDVCESLDIGGFHQRHPQRNPAVGPTAPVCTDMSAAQTLMDGPWLRGNPTLVGAVPGFDESTLRDLLIRTRLIDYDSTPWHYHLMDAETYAAGALGWVPPYSSDALTAALGLDPTGYARHHAYDDAVWAYDLLMAARRYTLERS
ncbi:hypothetical protein [Actinomadura violacea]|uniref:Exonuclease n=1 Tax=Actinomadura violacea TaxID=2819934 RepID=A0ABS3RXX6_9ACTN|nr:hypothetical protein [Actinomadura violacea]MBO2461607.1 hypothetical protein [Actinomadura violacea]